MYKITYFIGANTYSRVGRLQAKSASVHVTFDRDDDGQDDEDGEGDYEQKHC